MDLRVRHSDLLDPTQAVFLEEENLIICGDVEFFLLKLEEEASLSRT